MKIYEPLVSILTPAWNRELYLKRLWESLSNQEYSNIEWIIANDGSTDGTLELCRYIQLVSKFSVTIINSDIRVGKAKMDNELISAAKGELIAWCDSDDYLLPHSIKRLCNIWESISEEDRDSYIGVTSLCATEEGVIQSKVPNIVGIFDTTWSDLENIHNVKTDTLIFFRANLIRNCRFLEVDFVVNEGILWNQFFNMKTRFVPEIMKIMYRGADNRISNSGKMEYCRGKAYSLAICENYFISSGHMRESKWRLITFHRYCIHGDIGLRKAYKLYNANLAEIIWIMFYPFGLLLAIKDIIQRKVIKTHIEFNKNIKLANIQMLLKNDLKNLN